MQREEALCMCNSFYQHLKVHMYTRVLESELRHKKSLTDYVLVKGKILKFLSVCDTRAGLII